MFSKGEQQGIHFRARDFAPGKNLSRRGLVSANQDGFEIGDYRAYLSKYVGGSEAGRQIAGRVLNGAESV